MGVYAYGVIGVGGNMRCAALLDTSWEAPVRIGWSDMARFQVPDATERR